MPDGWYMTDGTEGLDFPMGFLVVFERARDLPTFVRAAFEHNDRILTIEAAFARGPHKSMFGGAK